MSATSYEVYVMDGTTSDDVSVFFSAAKPQYVSEVGVGTANENLRVLHFVEITPSNGRTRGKLTRFPLGRVVAVAEVAA